VTITFLDEEATVQVRPSRAPFAVTADGAGVIGHAGVALLCELADRLELTRALAWHAGRHPARRHRHQAGRVLRDLAVMLADGGDCLSDLAVLRDQPSSAGPRSCRPPSTHHPQAGDHPLVDPAVGPRTRCQLDTAIGSRGGG
jgi:Transposase DDE domain group 1